MKTLPDLINQNLSNPYSSKKWENTPKADERYERETKRETAQQKIERLKNVRADYLRRHPEKLEELEKQREYQNSLVTDSDWLRVKVNNTKEKKLNY